MQSRLVDGVRFFLWPLVRRLCLSQLSLSEEDGLRMRLEFQKCLSVIDRCLVLPHAVSRTKLHAAMATWRKKGGEQMVNLINSFFFYSTLFLRRGPNEAEVGVSFLQAYRFLKKYIFKKCIYCYFLNKNTR